MRGEVKVTEEALDLGGGHLIPLEVRRNRRAQRISLRVDTIGPRVILVLPSSAPMRRGLDFVAEKAVWVQNRLARAPETVPFADGAEIPYLGVPHVVRHRPDARGGVWRDAGAIHVTGAPEHLPRRLADWFKAEARRELTARSHEKAARIDIRIAGISVRDTRSRWGSCSATGRINYSWRLILAPEFVLDYVVAHEVAHMVEMNHSPAFWAQVAGLTDQMDAGRRWLKRQGASLHAFGQAGGAGAKIG